MRIAVPRWVIPWLLLGFGCASSNVAPPEPDPGEITETEIQVGEMVFDARRAGPDDGDLVILLHGFPQTSYEWRAQLKALGEAGYRAVAPDQRGYSPRARPTGVEAYEIPLLVDDVLEMAEALGSERFHLVGHDWGAVIAWVTATLEPGRVLSLTTVSIPHPDAFATELADTESCQYEASAYFEFFSQEGSEAALLSNDAVQLRAIYLGLSEDAIDEYLRALGTEEALGAALDWYRANTDGRQVDFGPLGLTSVPTLFIWSDQDIAVCREGAEATGDFVSGEYRFETLEGVNHWVPELAAAEVSQWLIEHLAN
ncbi:MAG: alpha/beta hydrolase [Myxococcota bacterium]